MSINLLPEEVISVKKQQTKKSLVTLTLFIYCSLFLATAGVMFIRIQAMERQAAEWDLLQEEINLPQERLLQLEEEIAVAQEEYTALQTLLSNKPKHTETINTLQHYLVPYLFLHEITLSQEGWLILQGKAEAMSSIGEFAASLGSDAYFLEVNVTQLQAEPDGKHSFVLELLTQGGTEANEI